MNNTKYQLLLQWSRLLGDLDNLPTQLYLKKYPKPIIWAAAKLFKIASLLPNPIKNEIPF